VTTDAAGRAVATGFAPTGSGAVQISATAAFQGQTAAAVTIAQTTVMTAAQAAAAAGAAGAASGGASAGAGAGAGGSGGGLSGTTIATVAGAVAGGPLIVKELQKDAPRSRTVTGQFSATLPMTFPGPPSCTRVEAHAGQVQIDITDDNADGAFVVG
jgi:hypothetical protein